MVLRIEPRTLYLPRIPEPKYMGLWFGFLGDTKKEALASPLDSSMTERNKSKGGAGGNSGQCSRSSVCRDEKQLFKHIMFQKAREVAGNVAQGWDTG